MTAISHCRADFSHYTTAFLSCGPALLYCMRGFLNCATALSFCGPALLNYGPAFSFCATGFPYCATALLYFAIGNLNCREENHYARSANFHPDSYRAIFNYEFSIFNYKKLSPAFHSAYDVGVSSKRIDTSDISFGNRSLNVSTK